MRIRKGAAARPDTIKCFLPIFVPLIRTASCAVPEIYGVDIMYQRISKILIIIAVSFGLLSCAAKHVLEQKIVSEGATRLTAAQATEYLSGNTQNWGDIGGAYFHPDGKVDVKWADRTYYGDTWVARKDGKVCLSNKVGRVTSCTVYYKVNGAIWAILLEDSGKAEYNKGGPDSIMEGNQLSTLGTGG